MNPSCPLCKTNKRVSPHGREQYYCGKCDMLFDTSDDGGDYSDHNPAARLEREERRSLRKRAKGNAGE